MSSCAKMAKSHLQGSPWALWLVNNVDEALTDPRITSEQVSDLNIQRKLNSKWSDTNTSERVNSPMHLIYLFENHQNLDKFLNNFNRIWVKFLKIWLFNNFKDVCQDFCTKINTKLKSKFLYMNACKICKNPDTIFIREGSSDQSNRILMVPDVFVVSMASVSSCWQNEV